MQPSKLLPLLTAPGTNLAPRLVVEARAGGEPYSGWLVDRQFRAVARLLNFRFRFVGFDAEEASLAAWRWQSPLELPAVPQAVLLDWNDARLRRRGDWEERDGTLLGSGLPGTRLVLRSTAPQVALTFATDRHGGIIRVSCDDQVLVELDLYAEMPGVSELVLVDNPGSGEMKIRIASTGRHNPAALGAGLLLRGIAEHNGPPAVPAYAKPRPIPGAEEPMLHGDFRAALAALPADGVALDIGGGQRQIDDPRYLNLDSLAVDQADILADAQALPFRDNSIDLVHSCLTINRIGDPASFAREIHRVLKPGGRALVGALPLQWQRRASPHTFDISPEGLRALFAPFAECRIVSGGGLRDRVSALLGWAQLAPEVAAPVLDMLAGLEARVDPARLEALAFWAWADLRK